MTPHRTVTSAERARRYWSAPLRAARSKGVYEREGTVPDLDADLAVLRAIMDAQQRRRFFLVLLAVAVIALGGLLAATVRETGGAFFICSFPLAIVILIVRKFVTTYEESRIDYASAVLRKVAASPEPNSPVKLTLGLQTSMRSKFITKWYEGSALYENPWFKLEAPLASGDRLKLVRVEHVEYLVEQTGARIKRQWTWHWEDTIELVFGTSRAAPAAAARDAVEVDPGTKVVKLEGDAEAWRLGLRGVQVWSASTRKSLVAGSLDAVAVTLRAIAKLADLAGVAAPLAPDPAPVASARTPMFGSRALLIVLLVLSIAPATWAPVRMSDAEDRRDPSGELSESAQGCRREAVIAGLITLVLWAGVVALWLIPPRRGRREDRATVDARGAQAGPYR